MSWTDWYGFTMMQHPIQCTHNIWTAFIPESTSINRDLYGIVCIHFTILHTAMGKQGAEITMNLWHHIFVKNSSELVLIIMFSFNATTTRTYIRTHANINYIQVNVHGIITGNIRHLHRFDWYCGNSKYNKCQTRKVIEHGSVSSLTISKHFLGIVTYLQAIIEWIMCHAVDPFPQNCATYVSLLLK
jgi:hypothetical protein